MVAANVDSVPEDEKLLPVPKAVELETGYRPTPSTAWRWTKKGVGGVKLETAVLGGRPVTSRKNVREFVAQTTAAKAGR
jgi:hypothetical protein